MLVEVLIHIEEDQGGCRDNFGMPTHAEGN